MERNYTIVVDTREQLPLELKGPIVRKKLNVGDYSILGYEDKIAIERKSAGDLFGTMFGGHKRFRDELDRAQSYEFFMILVECPYMAIRDKVFEGSFHHRQQGFSVLSMLWTLRLKYGVQFMFTMNRRESEAVIKDCFKSYVSLKEKEEKCSKVSKLIGKN